MALLIPVSCHCQRFDWLMFGGETASDPFVTDWNDTARAIFDDVIVTVVRNRGALVVCAPTQNVCAQTMTLRNGKKIFFMVLSVVDFDCCFRQQAAQPVEQAAAFYFRALCLCPLSLASACARLQASQCARFFLPLCCRANAARWC